MTMRMKRLFDLKVDRRPLIKEGDLIRYKNLVGSLQISKVFERVGDNFIVKTKVFELEIPLNEINGVRRRF